MNLLHDIESGTPETFNVIIETPRGSFNKYEIDKETGTIALDRVMVTAQNFPFDYGFVPQTLWDDGDALDVIVLTTVPLHPGILVRVRPVGIMNMIDTGDKDDKIISVPTEDKRWNNVRDLQDINEHTLKEMRHFFETYKGLEENKTVTIAGFKGVQDAQNAFTRSRDLYTKHNKK